MSRDSFDFDDFRESSWKSNSERDSYTLESFGFGRRSGSGSSDPTARLSLEKLRVAERTSDHEVTAARQSQDVSRTTMRGSRETAILDERSRGTYSCRDRFYSLRPSEIHTLTEVGKFRVINQEDFAELAYAGNHSRLENDVRNLIQQGLLERRETSPFKKQSRQVLTLTKRGRQLIRENEFVPDDQAIYSGLVKPKEADHDSALYRLYQKAAAEIEGQGGKILRVQLDYELKEQLYRKLGRRAKMHDRTEAFHLKNGFAQQLYLPVINGRVSFPDLRIEYTTQEMEIARVDLELATGHYHAGHLAEKARAGFQIYARSEDAAGLRRVRDDREIMTSILSL